MAIVPTGAAETVSVVPEIVPVKDASEYITLNVGALVSMTMALLAPRDPVVPGAASARCTAGTA